MSEDPIIRLKWERAWLGWSATAEIQMPGSVFVQRGHFWSLTEERARTKALRRASNGIRKQEEKKRNSGCMEMRYTKDGLLPSGLGEH